MRAGQTVPPLLGLGCRVTIAQICPRWSHNPRPMCSLSFVQGKGIQLREYIFALEYTAPPLRERIASVERSPYATWLLVRAAENE